MKLLQDGIFIKIMYISLKKLQHLKDMKKLTRLFLQLLAEQEMMLLVRMENITENRYMFMIIKVLVLI